MLQPLGDPVSLPLPPGIVAEDPLSQADYEAIKNALPTWRDVLIAKTLRGTGLRLSEALAVTADRFQVNGPDAFLFIRRGKKKGEAVYERTYLPPALSAELRAYIDGLKIAPTDKIWPVSRIQFWRVFSVAGKRALGRKVHPHMLRGLYIKTLLDGGIPVSAAAKMVGHANSRTTEQWYYRLSGEQRAAIQRRMPV